MSKKYVAEPFKIKMVEPIKMTTKEEREVKIANANYNLFSLKADDVYIDLLTDSGTGAMSSKQWSAVMLGDESYSGASSYFKLVDAAKDVFGYKYIQPVHQGRAAEKVLIPLFAETGKYAISNMHFDTTRAHVELTGAKAIDCVVPEALDTVKYAPFKGNMDVARMENLINEFGPENVGVIIMTVTNNTAGGQPVSMKNMRETYEVAKKYNIPVLIDAARYAENAYFIKTREVGYEDKTIKEIVREMFSYGDMMTMSSKKDAIVNMGGLIGIKDDEELYDNIKARTISFEGFVSYGGLAGRDLEALAVGLYEGIDYDYLRYRIGQMEYIANRLDEAEIAYQSPVGGHAIFIDAKKLLPHIPYYQFPAQALAIELYKEAGIRSCDIGSYMLDNDPVTGEQRQSELELTRLAVPRRVYTQAHLDVIVDALISIKERASEINGYEITWQPKVLRHFTSKLKPVK
ncbi:tryptophanase [Paraclostridium sordellii]|uniref:tryptophanase n=1 Tax=Paraclostridium sordellii TaxID=1505 RepID=UPI0005E629BE|nr:tryptophanase [Paeniclostridium sordellii]CEO06003.1 tryptophanase [[Clostridium] sordellii] [Paeniclostridium sordellii]CEP86322.1 tryptophanase [[Clostridium] sordellii] [Paeniclostridium sordellii]CEP96574.1 tryptophanase [[Clostridium] sordellii] [Paeniclostridium sordellii]CEP99960.1 tryptophanase [[Clostridium] sordellii] [Paeniclostridium sordellii]